MVKCLYFSGIFGYLFTNIILPYYYLNCLEVVDLVSYINVSTYLKTLNLKIMLTSSDFFSENLLNCLEKKNFIQENVYSYIRSDFNLNVIYLLYSVSDYLKPLEIQTYTQTSEVWISYFELIFILQFVFIKFIFGNVTPLTFWLIPSFLLFIGGIIVFLLIRVDELDMKVWYVTGFLLLFSTLFQFINFFLFFSFLYLGFELQYGFLIHYYSSINAVSLMKPLISLLCLIILDLTYFILINFYKKNLFLIKSEVCPLILFLGFGCTMVFFQNNLLSIFLYLEIISFCIYGLLYLNTRTNEQLNAFTRYVMLGMWVSAIFILGICLHLSWVTFEASLSLLQFFEYFNQNSTYFLCEGIENSSFDINFAINYKSTIFNLEFFLALILFLIFFFFKLGAGPFYTWVVDVYNSCSLGFLLAVSTLPKFVYSFLLFYLLHTYFFIFADFWSPFLFVVGLITLFTGAVGAIRSEKLKEIYSWSSIIHTGNILLIISCFKSDLTVFVLVFYLIIYTLISFSFLNMILLLKVRRTGRFIKTIYELSYIKDIFSISFWLGCIIVLSSAAGFTPLITFFMKFSLFYLLVDNYGLFSIVTVGLINILGSFIYLKMLRYIISFNTNTFSTWKFLKPKKVLVLNDNYSFNLSFLISSITICFGFLIYLELLELFLDLFD